MLWLESRSNSYINIAIPRVLWPYSAIPEVLWPFFQEFEQDSSHSMKKGNGRHESRKPGGLRGPALSSVSDWFLTNKF